MRQFFAGHCAFFDAIAALFRTLRWETGELVGKQGERSGNAIDLVPINARRFLKAIITEVLARIFPQEVIHLLWAIQACVSLTCKAVLSGIGV